MPLPPPTELEIIEVLKRTNIPTILCEGTSDAYIYREITNRIDPSVVSFIHCGGRDTLLQVHLRKAEYAGKKVAYIADQDTLYFAGIPAQYSDIVFTTGYSIENDLLTGASLDKLFSDQEKQQFDTAVGSILPWYAAEIHKHLSGDQYEISQHIRVLLDIPALTLAPAYQQAAIASPPPPELLGRITSDLNSLCVAKLSHSYTHSYSIHHEEPANTAMRICGKFAQEFLQINVWIGSLMT
jgi:hypothetical protein